MAECVEELRGVQWGTRLMSSDGGCRKQVDSEAAARLIAVDEKPTREKKMSAGSGAHVVKEQS